MSISYWQCMTGTPPKTPYTALLMLMVKINISTYTTRKICHSLAALQMQSSCTCKYRRRTLPEVGTLLDSGAYYPFFSHTTHEIDEDLWLNGMKNSLFHSSKMLLVCALLLLVALYTFHLWGTNLGIEYFLWSQIITGHRNCLMNQLKGATNISMIKVHDQFHSFRCMLWHNSFKASYLHKRLLGVVELHHQPLHKTNETHH